MSDRHVPLHVRLHVRTNVQTLLGASARVTSCEEIWCCNSCHKWAYVYLALPPRDPAPPTGPTTRLPTYSPKLPPPTGPRNTCRLPTYSLKLSPTPKPLKISSLPNHSPSLAPRSDPSVCKMSHEMQMLLGQL